MVYSEVPNFSEPNPEYSAQQAPNKTVSPMASVWGRRAGQAKKHGGKQGLSMYFVPSGAERQQPYGSPAYHRPPRRFSRYTCSLPATGSPSSPSLPSLKRRIAFIPFPNFLFSQCIPSTQSFSQFFCKSLWVKDLGTCFYH